MQTPRVAFKWRKALTTLKCLKMKISFLVNNIAIQGHFSYTLHLVLSGMEPSSLVLRPFVGLDSMMMTVEQLVE
jgi:hypothetical protein